MIHAAIVEDEKSYQEQLKRYIRKYEAESGQKVHLRVFNDGDEIIDHYAGNYDIIFLDIEMRRMNGMEAARRIRKLDADVILIFITNMAQYAIQGYEVQALDYVVKPIRYFAFTQEMEKAVKKIQKKETHYLSIQQERRLNSISFLKVI